MSITLSPDDTDRQLRTMLASLPRGWRFTRRYASLVRLVAIGIPANFLSEVDEILVGQQFDRFTDHVRQCTAEGSQFDQPDTTVCFLSVPVDQRAAFRETLTARRDAASDNERAFIDAAIRVVAPVSTKAAL